MARYLPKPVKASLAASCCAVCGTTAGAWEADHVHPVGLGGGNEPENFRRLCVPCHRKKTNRDIKAISKTKRLIKKRNGTWKRKGPPMQSRGFQIWRKFNGEIVRRS